MSNLLDPTPRCSGQSISRGAAELLLVTATLFWGATFTVVKDAIGEVPVLCFLWVRFALAALLLAPHWNRVSSR